MLISGVVGIVTIVGTIVINVDVDDVVAFVFEVVVEYNAVTMETLEILRKSSVMYRHLVCTKNSTNVKDIGVHQRNTMPEHIGRHKLDGIMYFADDANIYLLKLLESLQEISTMEEPTPAEQLEVLLLLLAMATMHPLMNKVTVRLFFQILTQKPPQGLCSITCITTCNLGLSASFQIVEMQFLTLQSVEVSPSESFLNGGEWPTLNVVSKGHVMHVFINGQLSGSAHSTRQNKRFRFIGNINLHAGTNRIALLSIAMGLPAYINAPDGDEPLALDMGSMGKGKV
ncbi:hypothetical protein GIB67_015573 [Kingdonia uniflora]|uniref:Glycosyltransferases n=1 Tax=Kingdonia uniflora TaxID=39325 RepID=A0A7J7LU13_9MAGN|nr:hypothetical protein GIB67_015573 [Kingdonia uniflora]